MKWNCWFIVSLAVFHARCFPSADQYLLGLQRLIPSFDKRYLFDGPYNISSARIETPIKTVKPTRQQMMYYNYYTASVNCAFGVKTMECGYCSKIKGDIKHFVVIENSTHTTACLVALSEKRKEIVVAYRATNNWWNWVLDADIVNISPHGADRIKIHRGFYIAAMSLYERVVKTVGAFRLLKKEYASYKLIITGHSLGAATARVTEFLLLYLKQFPGVLIEVYAYGEPRSGNKHYVEFLNKQAVKSARIVNRADFFCHVPPTSILGTSIISDYYYHATNEYWINGEQETFAARSGYEDSTTANSYGPTYNTMDHLLYFDVNHYRCLTDIHSALAVPIFFQPTEKLPPFPKPIQNLLTDAADLQMRIGTAIVG